MRVILIDWMSQVSADYFMKRQTFHRSVMMLDNYLIRCDREISGSDFQLIGITCLFIAAKIEEIYPQHINAFVESTQDSVSADQMREKELDIMNALQWNFDNFITPFEWATWFMARWDHYVDETLSYLQADFNLKFYDYSCSQHRKYATVIQFVDFASMHDGMW